MKKELSRYIVYGIFVDTPLDIAMARRVWKDIKLSLDYVIAETKELEEKVEEIKNIIITI